MIKLLDILKEIRLTPDYSKIDLIKYEYSYTEYHFKYNKDSPVFTFHKQKDGTYVCYFFLYEGENTYLPKLIKILKHLSIPYKEKKGIIDGIDRVNIIVSQDRVNIIGDEVNEIRLTPDINKLDAIKHRTWTDWATIKELPVNKGEGDWHINDEEGYLEMYHMADIPSLHEDIDYIKSKNIKIIVKDNGEQGLSLHIPLEYINIIDKVNEIRLTPDTPKLEGRIINKPHNSEIWFDDLEAKYWLNDEYAFRSYNLINDKLSLAKNILTKRGINFKTQSSLTMVDIIIPINQIEITNRD